MNNHSKKNAFSRALSYLEGAIKKQKQEKKSRIPTNAMMAADAGVAYETMRKAVNQLVSRGALIARPGMGIHIAGTAGRAEAQYSTLPSVRADNRLRWQKAVSEIKKDILQGQFGWNKALPSQKEMLRKYRVSYPTLRKALQVCVDEKIVVPEGRWYATSLKKTVMSYSRIILIGDEREETGIAKGICGDDFTRSLEHACAISGVRLEMYSYRWCEGDLEVRNVATGEKCSIQDDNDILGFIYVGVFAREIESRLLDRDDGIADVMEVFNAVIRLLLSYKRPIAVYTFEQDLTLSIRHGRESPVRIFRMAAPETSAVKVGRYLLSKHHKHIAYISPFHQALWSQLRYEALVRTFTDAGYGDKVRLVSINDHYSLLSYFSESEHHFNIENIVRTYEQWRREKNPPFTENFDHSFRRFCRRYMTVAELYYRFGPFLERLMNDRRISAWIAANDGVAEIILDFLKAQGKKVPDFVSLASFDNTVVAVRHGITSFDFNIPAAVNSMIAFLINPGAVTREKRENIGDVEGVIIERNSITTGTI
ncbi:MAG: GntR family transcriptional regulator [Chitinivibrionales bacterium]|nr:GntR family transcriptional regulator [Chitinivibrionales bacterium]